MFQLVPKILKWVSIPVLLIAAVFSSLEARYEPLVDLVIWLGALFLAERSAWAKQYFWAAGFAAIVILFSPLSLVGKFYLSMGLTCVVTLLTLFASFRTRPAVSVVSLISTDR